MVRINNIKMRTNKIETEFQRKHKYAGKSRIIYTENLLISFLKGMDATYVAKYLVGSSNLQGD